MSCNCIPQIVQSESSKKCEDCLKVVSLRYACADGPAPCGDTLVEDLSDFNDVDVCDCGSVVYSIVDYDEDAFDSVVITSEGEITVTTSDQYIDKEEYCITYKVDCPCNVFSGIGNIYICMENLCSSVVCTDTEFCDPCDGTCKDKESDLDVTDGSVDAYAGGGTGFSSS